MSRQRGGDKVGGQRHELIFALDGRPGYGFRGGKRHSRSPQAGWGCPWGGRSWHHLLRWLVLHWAGLGGRRGRHRRRRCGTRCRRGRTAGRGAASPGRGPGLRLAWRLGLMAEHPLLVGAWGSTLPPLLLPSGPVLLPPPLDLGGRVEKDPLVRAGGKSVGGRDEGSPSHVGPPHRAAPLSWPRASVPQRRRGASQRGRPECRRARRWCDRVGRGVQGARALCSGCRASDDLTAGGPRLLRTQGCGRGRAWLSRRGRGGRVAPAVAAAAHPPLAALA